MSTAHHVTFWFRLPPVLLLHVEPGRWSRSPLGCAVTVGEDGTVTIVSSDHHETFASDQVRAVAASFLRMSIKNAPPVTIVAALSGPTLRRRRGPEAFDRYAISLGTKVSIARTDERPVTAGAAEDSLNFAVG